LKIIIFVFFDFCKVYCNPNPLVDQYACARPPATVICIAVFQYRVLYISSTFVESNSNLGALG
jgi:hypothetical protein